MFHVRKIRCYIDTVPVRTNYFKFSFFNHYISVWNSLPEHVMSSPSLQSFKSSLLKHLRSQTM